MDIRKWYDKYSIDIELIYNSKATKDNYKSQVLCFLNKFSGELQPKSIDNEKIKLWLLEANTINTRKHRLCAINSFYKVTIGMPNKIKSIPYPRSDKKLPQVLSVEEVQRMFDVCQNLKHKVILSLLYSTGMRVSELVNLQWSHIDRSRMVINVIGGKGGKDRQVMLCHHIIPLLEKYYTVYKSKVYVLNGQFGGMYSSRSVLEIIKQLGEKAKLNKRVYTHLMRHNCFTHLLESGTDISIIKEIAGHNSMKTTLMYTHISHNLISKVNSPFSSIKI